MTVQVRTLTDTPDRLRVRLTRLHESGRLVGVTRPTPAPDQPGKMLVRARVLPAPELRTAARSRPQPVRWSWRRKLAVGGAAAVPALGAVGLLVYEVWVYRYAILGVLVVVAILLGWYGLGQAGACPGIHCPGCRCGGR